MTSWEYMQKRRKWTATRILRGMNDQSWEQFQLFFAEHGVECPDKLEYDTAMKEINPPVAAPPKPKPPVKKKTAATKSRRKTTAKK